jgi:hypothetical protein
MSNWKPFNDAFEAEIEAQEFMIDEAEWNAVIKALKAGHNAFAKQIEKDILELIEIGGKFREPEDDLDRGVQIGYDTAKEELRLKLKEYIDRLN